MSDEVVVDIWKRPKPNNPILITLGYLEKLEFKDLK